MKNNKSASLFQKEQVMESLKQSFVKLNPRMMIKNPIMFTVEIVTAIMLSRSFHWEQQNTVLSDTILSCL